ncbi:MAG TPA: iron ABC transporter permease [Peptococcaceae bacterium]|nr:iron ABC transporter permease [Peptococcaceae bacterium]
MRRRQTANMDNPQKSINPPKGSGSLKSRFEAERIKFAYLLFLAAMVFAMILCVSLGSVQIPFGDTYRVILGQILGDMPGQIPEKTATIILKVRLPRVLTVACVGAALSVSGAAMQGLLKNPLADGSTLGVAAGASLGAVLAIAFNVQIDWFPGGGSTLFSMLFAFLSLLMIMAMARRIDFSMSTNTIILVGVIYSMFCSSITSLLITFAGNKAKDILFWMMGSFAGSNYGQLMLAAGALLVCGIGLLRYGEELNAFAIGEENARHIGVSVKGVKLAVMLLASALIGITVSISGTIGFVGLIIPHMTRMLTGPNHRRLLPFSMLAGAVFLMLADLVSRILLRPMELPIGVITSFVGSLVFFYIFYCSRRTL